MTAKKTVIDKVEKFLNDYCVFAFNGVAFPIALWVFGTHCFEAFDAFAYMVITASVKRCGKTRASEIIGFVSHHSYNTTAMRPASVFNLITAEKPTIICDEAEALSGESASFMREVLNAGYRKGQKIIRAMSEHIREYDVFCPKIFILIGDVYDTLRDRSIVIEMKRGEPKERFMFDSVKATGQALQDEIKQELEFHRGELQQAYFEANAPFLSDRDEEIWRPLFTLCNLICPERFEELQRFAVDLSGLKTSDKRRYVDLAQEESKADESEYAVRLLKDVKSLYHDNHRVLFSNQVIDRLLSLPLAPWRVFKGVGLNMQGLADMLSRFGLHPVMVRQGKKINRGYRKEHVESALKRL